MRTARLDALRRHFARRGRVVLTFVGYSSAGYQDPDRLERTIGRVLAEFDPRCTLVNCGATAVGIGAVYALAKRRGFATRGVVSTLAPPDTFAPAADLVFRVPDSQWGGFVPGTRRLSPTSRAMVALSDVLVAIGGNSTARIEWQAARRRGKRVRVIPAEMNHAAARDRAARAGRPEPTGFGGATARVCPRTTVRRYSVGRNPSIDR